MDMKRYRAYLLNQHSELVGAINLDCTDDQAAQEHVKRLPDDHHMVELWRFVAQIKSNSPRSGPNGECE
jgi:hypothetical protein